MKYVKLYPTTDEYKSDVASKSIYPRIIYVKETGLLMGEMEPNKQIAFTADDNPELIQIAITAGWIAESSTAMTIGECNNVMTLKDVDFSTLVSFDELTYFESLIEIEDGVFKNCTNLNNITIPSNITKIGDESFYGCTGLTCITLPDSITKIGKNAFYGCTNIEYLIVESMYPCELGEGAFDGADYLIYVPENCEDDYKNNSYWSVYADRIFDLPEPVANDTTNIELMNIARAYGWVAPTATELTVMDISKIHNIDDVNFTTLKHFNEFANFTNVTVIPNAIFEECTLLEEIQLPNTITKIGACAFNKCESLTEIFIPYNVTIIDDKAFNECTSLETIDLSLSKITSIESMMFVNCESLTTVSLPSTVTNIKTNAFYNCSNLTNISINNVTVIGVEAFKNCSSLNEITLGENITKIGSDAFYNCSSASTITCLSDTPCEIGNRCFDNTNDCPIIVNENAVDAYKASWTAYADRITSE